MSDPVPAREMPPLLQQILDRNDARVRAVLAEHPEALAGYDAAMAHVSSGGSACEGLWSVLTSPQRAALSALRGGADRAVRLGQGNYGIGSARIGASTIAALIRRGILAHAGSRDDPAQVVVPTARCFALMRYLATRQ